MWTGCWITHIHKAVLCCYSLNISSLGGTMFIIAQPYIAWFSVCAAKIGYRASLCSIRGAFLLAYCLYHGSRNFSSMVLEISSVMASRYWCKVCNLFLCSERRSWVMDAPLQIHSSFSCIPDSSGREKFEVSSGPQSGDYFVMEKIQLREILDPYPCLSSPQSI